MRCWCLVEVLKLMLNQHSVIGNQPSGPLCLWQCLIFRFQSQLTCSTLSSLCFCSVMSSSFSCFVPRLVRAANEVNRRDNSFEALSTTPGDVDCWLYIRLLWIVVKLPLRGRWVLAKRDGIHFPAPRFGEISPKIYISSFQSDKYILRIFQKNISSCSCADAVIAVQTYIGTSQTPQRLAKVNLTPQQRGF